MINIGRSGLLSQEQTKNICAKIRNNLVNNSNIKQFKNKNKLLGKIIHVN